MTFLRERVLSLSEHCLLLCVQDNILFKIGSVLSLAEISKQARAIVMQVLVKKGRAAGVGCTKGGKSNACIGWNSAKIRQGNLKVSNK